MVSNNVMVGQGPVEAVADALQEKVHVSVAKKAAAVADNGQGSAGTLELSPQPEFIGHRIKMFDEIKREYDAFVAAQPRVPIKITLPDGRSMDGVSWESTAMSIAKLISNSLADRLVIAKVNGELYDTLRPLEGDCTLELLDFEHEEGRQVFWHSSAHVLGEACERHYGCHLCLGPPIEDGFYYEMGLPGGASASQADYPALNTLAKAITKEKQPFERLVLTKEQLLRMFQDNPYKVRLIQDKIADNTSSTVYRCGQIGRAHV